MLLAALAAALSGCLGCNDQPRIRMIGSAAPDFTVQDSDRTVALHDLHGKVIVLNFWTSWCEPCIVEMPSLMQLQKQMAPKVIVVGISTDEDDRAYHNFLRRYNIDFLTVRDPDRNLVELRYYPS